MLDIQPHLEIQRICSFIWEQARHDGRLIIGVSGGIDSDVVARLCVGALGAERVRLVTVLQDDMEEQHICYARRLAQALDSPLVEIDLAFFPRQLIESLSLAERMETFSTASRLDLGKAKNSLRTWVHSMYAERGYIVVGCSNRTEREIGFYLPFGDGISHIMPIAHLYKTQVKLLARVLGTPTEVIQQPPSAGYWPGETDLEDIAFWMFHGAPVMADLCLNEPDLSVVRSIHQQLSFESIDEGLYDIGLGSDVVTVAERSGLSIENAERLMRLVYNAAWIKGRPMREHL